MRVWGFRVLGFRGLGFRVLGFRVKGLGKVWQFGDGGGVDNSGMLALLQRGARKLGRPLGYQAFALIESYWAQEDLIYE